MIHLKLLLNNAIFLFLYVISPLKYLLIKVNSVKSVHIADGCQLIQIMLFSICGSHINLYCDITKINNKIKIIK